MLEQVFPTDEQRYKDGFAQGQEARRRFGKNSDAIARRTRFDHQMVQTNGGMGRAFHQGRIDGLLDRDIQEHLKGIDTVVSHFHVQPGRHEFSTWTDAIAQAGEECRLKENAGWELMDSEEGPQYIRHLYVDRENNKHALVHAWACNYSHC